MNFTKKKILVVLGGNSRERKISLITGQACYKSLKKLGYKVDKFDPQKKMFNLINKETTDIIFNALHGKEGEDGLAQSYFEYLRIPYTHSGVISSINAMDKEISKNIFLKNNILTPKFFIINNKNYQTKLLPLLIKKNNIKFPIIVKPSNEGSSIGVKICKSIIDLKKTSKILIKKYKNLIFEQFISGKEIQVAVLNNRAMGAIELRPKRNFYDYKAKYLKSSKTKHVMPASINQKKYKEILKIAEKIHKIFNCRGVTRTDFKFYKNRFYVLEINTQPGMTSLSLVPEIAKYKKISFDQLIKKLILDASINK
jgi:D-alanine-D-alanine ligase